MLSESDQPTLREVLSGWFIVRSGKSQSGDKYWRPHDRVWLPLVWSDAAHGVDVREDDMPVVIRKNRS